MNKLRQAIIDGLKQKFPDLGESVKAFVTLLDEQTDAQISYPSPAILVSILPVQEAPIELAPWELRVNIGLVMTVKTPGALKRDIAGWDFAIEVAQVVYRNVWGFGGMYVTPAVITSLQKNEQLDKTGTPTGNSYWTLTFYHWVKMEAFFQ